MSKPLDLNVLAQELERQNHPWEMTHSNSLSDLSEEEKVKLLGFTPGPDDISLDDAVKVDVGEHYISSEEMSIESISLPNKFDNRNVNGKNFTTPVKNQGGCGSCVAFATAAVLETCYKRSHNNPSLDLNLSEAHLFFCYAKDEGRHCGNGWWPQNALENVKKNGLTTDDYFPYQAQDQACNLKNGWKSSILNIGGYKKVSGRSQMKQWLVKKGSLTGCFIVYADFFNYRSGVYRHVSGEAKGGHCVEIVGYDDTQGCWICKNSWGTNWGDNGFFKIAYGQCQIETWAGPYSAENLTLKNWVKNAKIIGLWSNTQQRNSAVYLQGLGWKKISNANDSAHHIMLSQCISAKAANRRISALQDRNEIQELYVL